MLETDDINKIRFDQYKGVDYVMLIDDETYTPFMLIRESKDKYITYKLTRTMIEDNFHNGINLFTHLIDKYLKETRKKKLEKLNLENNI